MYRKAHVRILRCLFPGKEKLFLEVGKALQKYVYVGSAKQRLLDCMDLTEEDKRWLTTKDQESHIHVVPLWSVASFKRMGSISRHYHVLYGLFFSLVLSLFSAEKMCSCRSDALSACNTKGSNTMSFLLCTYLSDLPTKHFQVDLIIMS